jgi:hypothetical protein
MDTTIETIDCACVIHGTAYDWTYVERLYNMLSRHLTRDIRLHVYTEADRPVPASMIKHALEDWGISGPRRGWWYKLQLFNSAYHTGPMLYFDLDTVIVDNIDWICDLPLSYFWTVQDFKYLWRPNYQSINSSVMWWNTSKFDHVWNSVANTDIHSILRRHRGDQDFLNVAIADSDRRYLDPARVKSWRWQCKDGGYDFASKSYKMPNTGTVLTKETGVLVFHGKPKPIEIHDPCIDRHWR